MISASKRFFAQKSDSSGEVSVVEPTALLQQFLAAFQANFPRIPAWIEADSSSLQASLPNGKKIALNVDSLISDLKIMDGQAHSSAIARHFDSLFELVRSNLGDSVAPTFKEDEILPMVRQRGYGGEAASEAVVGTVASTFDVFLVGVKGQSVCVVLPQQVGGGLFGASDLLTIAKANLANKRKGAVIHRTNGICLLEMDDIFESSVLLDTAFWQEEAGNVKSLVAMVPLRGKLLWTDGSRSDLTSALQLVSQGLADSGPHLSRDLLRWTGLSWEALSD